MVDLPYGYSRAFFAAKSEAADSTSIALRQRMCANCVRFVRSWLNGRLGIDCGGLRKALRMSGLGTQEPTVAPPEGLLSEAVLKHACVGPNRRP
jgi:hypothetical protein